MLLGAPTNCCNKIDQLVKLKYYNMLIRNYNSRSQNCCLVLPFYHFNKIKDMFLRELTLNSSRLNLYIYKYILNNKKTCLIK